MPVSRKSLMQILFLLICFLVTYPALADSTNNPLSFSNITVKGSPGGAPLKQLDKTELLSMQTEDGQSIGTWLGIIRNLQTAQPEVHIIDNAFFSDKNKTGLAVEYGTHEAYARYHGFAQSSVDFIKQVQGTGQNKTLMPFTLHIPLSGPANLEGKSINWVFQNRRYNYKDSSNDFVKALIKSQQAVKQHLFPGSPADFRPAFITYDKPGTRRPNLQGQTGKQDIQGLKQAGFQVITENQLELIQGAIQQQVYVMNPGTEEGPGQYAAYGRLRHITDISEDGSGASSINDLTPKDIALFEALPERIPPVAGIIVLEKQTALSHVNILARNRGTMNISLNSTTPGIPSNDPAFIRSVVRGFAPSLYGKPVRLSIRDGKLNMVETTEAQVDNFLQRQQQARGTLDIEQPVVVAENRWLLDPAAEGLGVNQVGAKAANYGLIQNWLKDSQLVLPGKAIGFNLYLKTIAIAGPNGKPQDLINQLLAHKNELSMREMDHQLAAIQESINSIPLEQMPTNASGKTLVAELAELLNGQYRQAGRIRFRSSTNCEDLPTFNGAGLYESEGFTAMELDSNGRRIIDEKKLWKKLKNVLASLWLPRAFHERDYFGIDHAKAAMAIQVNPAFSDEWLEGISLYEWGNGVVLYDEHDGKKNFQINSQFGTASVTNPLPGELPESLLIINGQLQEIRGRSSIQGKSHNIFLTANEDLLAAAEVGWLKRLHTGAEIIFKRKILENPDPVFSDTKKYGIDIEFKIMFDNNRQRKIIFIKQARPLLLRTS